MRYRASTADGTGRILCGSVGDDGAALRILVEIHVTSIYFATWCGLPTRACRSIVGTLLASVSLVAIATPSAVTLNTLGMPFVRIPAGEFLMGSDETPAQLAAAFPQYDAGRLQKFGDEAPVHRVRITHDFDLGQTKVTVGQFRRFVEASGYRTEAERDGTGGYGYNRDYDPATSPRGDAFEGRRPQYSWRNTGFPQSDAQPVVNVTWNDAVNMAAWLSEQEGVRYRLPSEAEWEYACRAGTRTRYTGGDDPLSLAVTANVFDLDTAANWPQWRQYALPVHRGYSFSAPVASFAPNAFDLYDMLGNAWEWVADWYAEDYYAKSPVDDPSGPTTGSMRVRRGGSWHTWPLYARIAFRNWNTPETRYTLLGFRLLREIEPVATAKPRGEN